MIRRRFLGLTLAGVGGVVAMEGMDLAEQKTVTFRISGFTCITCAVGLETLLAKGKRRDPGEGQLSGEHRDGDLSPETDLRAVPGEVHRERRIQSHPASLSGAPRVYCFTTRTSNVLRTVLPLVACKVNGYVPG